MGRDNLRFFQLQQIDSILLKSITATSPRASICHAADCHAMRSIAKNSA